LKKKRDERKIIEKGKEWERKKDNAQNKRERRTGLFYINIKILRSSY
jgi:hypothetical protein